MTGADGDTLYTRDGAFNTNANGELVTLDGYTVEPAISVPSGTIDIAVNQSGEVYARVGTGNAAALGQLTLANFANDAGLEPLGSNLYRETDASGGPVTGVPADPGFAKIHQGYLDRPTSIRSRTSPS